MMTRRRVDFAGWLVLLASLAVLWACGDPEGAVDAKPSSPDNGKITDSNSGTGDETKKPTVEKPTVPAATPTAEKPAPRPTPSRGAATTFHPKAGLSAPAICVYQLLKLSGDSMATYQRIFEGITREKAVGADLEHLKNLLSALGVRSEVRKEPLPVLLAADRPGIILARARGSLPDTPSGRYVLCLGREAGGVRVLDPEVGLQVVKEEHLRSRYLGVNLRLDQSVERSAKDAPDLVCEEILWNYGRVPAGTQITHSFRLRNRGTKPLKVSLIKERRCCVPIAQVSYQDVAPSEQGKPAGPAVTKSDGEIQPGKSGWITAHLDTLSRKGNVTFTAKIRTNDPEEPDFSIFLAGTIIQTFPFEPFVTWFYEVPSRKGAVTYVWIRHHEGKPFKITDLKSPLEFITATVDPDPPRIRKPLNAFEAKFMAQQTEHPESQGWVGIKIHCLPGAPVGPISGKFTLKADGLPVEIAFAGKIRGNFNCIPPAFGLGAVKRGEAQEMKMRISTSLGAAFKIDRVEVDLGFMQTHVELIEKGAYWLTLRLTKGWDAPSVNGNVTIHSSDPQEPKKKIKTYGFVTRDR